MRIAWEIHLHQQKQQAESRSSSSSSNPEGTKGPSTDPLRPPSHLFPSSMPRPGAAAAAADLVTSSSLLGESLALVGWLPMEPCSQRNVAYSLPGPRSPFEAGHPFLTPGVLGKPRGECSKQHGAQLYFECLSPSFLPSLCWLSSFLCRHAVFVAQWLASCLSPIPRACVVKSAPFAETRATAYKNLISVCWSPYLSLTPLFYIVYCRAATLPTAFTLCWFDWTQQ